ncbi:M57 family metalloprotease [Chitinophaga nivalis]|uniref:M57 family metalloprotease n=1 Tax=Chitinophaga nivalis TaxID=2991709 RepID=A0ABT3IIS6_9BACT|nr:M57 family metalloprotease [Chitinophaga nivalis]MCW3466441.1 M57 family metalloprotease [Chitinophaga nivalis]MCW3483868.1 M57 family metalloprotease [Chitinophaga nivalis]
MKYFATTLLCVMLISCFVCIQSCKKEEKVAATTSADIPAAVLSKIKAQGFSTRDVKKVEGGYVVEGDIFLSTAALAEQPVSPTMRVAQSEQYRTHNVITGLPRVITISVTNLPVGYGAAADVAIARFNALGLQLTFSRVASGGDVNIQYASLGSGVLGRSAGFPTSSGNPPSPILLNADDNALGSNPEQSYLASVITHEIGHTIGFRHTDYFNRGYSCSIGSNEGDGGVGAVPIPGSPTAEDPNSWMLACIGTGVTRLFNANDVSALDYLYGSRMLNPLRDGIYRLVNVNSRKVLDVSEESSNNGAVVHQWEWWNGNNQKWYLTYQGEGYYKLTAYHSGKVLDVIGGSPDNGAVLHQWDWWNIHNQHWRLLRNADGSYGLVNRKSGKVADVKDGSHSNGAVVQQWDWWAANHQRWFIEKL